MNRCFAIASCLALSLVTAACAQVDGSSPAAETDPVDATGFFLQPNDTVVFFGDSITALYAPTWSPWSPASTLESGANYNYAMNIVGWVEQNMPTSGIKFYDMAVPGETVEGDQYPSNGPHPFHFAPGKSADIDTHLEQIEAYDPTVVTVNLGMNDGELISNNATLAGDYVNGIEHIVTQLQTWSKAGHPLRIVLLGPSYFDYDRYVATGWLPTDDNGNHWSVSSTYNATLVGFAAWEKSYVTGLNNAGISNVTFIDLNGPMAAAAAALPSSQSLTQEGVHPTAPGYAVIASTILGSWGAPVSSLHDSFSQTIWDAFVTGEANVWHGGNTYKWNGNPITVGSSTTPPPGNAVDLTVASSAGLFWDSGNFARGATELQVYPSFSPNPAQNWAWTPSGAGFTVCNVGGSPCLSDNGTAVVMGAKADVITITSGSAIHDLTTGRYFQSPGGTAGAPVTTGSTQSVWTFSSNLHD